jgi:hypothetical protein
MASSNRAIGLSLTLMACVLLAGCGAFSKASDCPSPATREPTASNPVTAGPSRQSQPQQTTPQKDAYSFGLALGDRSAAGSWADQAVYEALTRKDCKAASAVLVNKDGDRGNSRPGWGDFDDPRQVLLFQAGYEQLCGKASKARDLYNMVKAKWGGWGGIGWAGTDRKAPSIINDAILSWHTCEMYRQVASVIEQKSAGSFKCSYVAFPDEVLDWQDRRNVGGVDKRWDPRGAKPATTP